MFYEMKRLLKTTGDGLRFIMLLILRSPVSFCMTAINAIFLQQAFSAVEQTDMSRLVMVCIVFIVASLGIFLYNGTVWSIYASFVVRMESKLRVTLFDKIIRFSCARIEATAHGDWLTRLNTDVQMPFSQPLHLPHAVNAILSLILSSLFLWIINPAVFLWVIVFIIPHFAMSRFFVVRYIQELNKKSLEATAKNTGEMTALITCADVALMYDGQDYLMQRFEKSSMELLRAKMKIIKRNAINAAIAILPFGLTGYLVLLVISGSWIGRGYLSFGDLTAAFQFRGGVLIGANMLINSIVSIKASMAGIQRVNETLHTEAADGQ